MRDDPDNRAQKNLDEHNDNFLRTKPEVDGHAQGETSSGSRVQSRSQSPP